ncbi:T9SS type A sorting domain-containing protein [Flavobacterium alkalisoli]|uniref:T9SS type A sorting domain-containing protein n=1 Tax=Flavobacterium alkalisoli TaxID=2602769 RepID=A0A5B9FY30_9FLAO|nr:T9SS type A sorting domain-containing protein [Flavobacterium alkalisoli]QEE49667.1 T9SS type A sorting domain-containing protein [Flavobacterium alkalisoli]
MKLKLPRFLCALVPLMSLSAAAQEYVPLTVTSGYNADVVANGAGSAASSTSIQVDNDSFAFLSTDFVSPSNASYSGALPATGLVNSAATAGLSYQFAPFSGNNSMRIPTSATSLTAVFSNQVMASKLYLLGTSGSGQSTISVTVNFTDATSQVSTGLILPDWFNSTLQPVAVSGFGRVSIATNAIETPTGNPRLYQLTVNIDAANQGKLIESVQVTKTSTAASVVNIMAFTADAIPSCPAPTNLTSSSTPDSGTVSWSPAPVVPSGGYDYYMSATNTPPTETTEVTNVANTVNSVTFEDLTAGTTYYVWVRSNCGTDDLGNWVMTTVTPGQLTVAYDGGVSSTEYMTNASPTSVSTCPALVSVDVPEGYQVASVSVAYSMTSFGSTWKSDQVSRVKCITTGLAESQVYAGVGNTAGTMLYNRTGLNIAAGATGTIQFELGPWRTFGSTGCGTTNAQLDSFSVTVTYEPFVCDLPAPDADDQIACGGIGFTVSDLMVSGAANVEFNWYATEDATEPLDTETLIEEDGTYYVSQYIGTCESDRTAVAVTVNSVNPPTADAEQTVCPGSLIADLTAEAETGGVLLWFLTADAPNPVGTNTPLTEGSYFVCQQKTGCRSPRVEVEVVFTDVPLPTVEDQEVCQGATIADLVVEGDEGAAIHWYATADSPFVLNGTTVLQEGTYFVAQAPENCGDSDRVEVQITFTEIPMPTASASQSLCEGATVGDLMALAEGEGMLNWYATADAPNPLAESTLIQPGSYFVSFEQEGCGESDRVEVVVDFNEIAAPGTETNQYFCGSVTVDELFSVALPGAQVQWYATEESEEPIAMGTQLEPGTYFARQVIAGCVSAANDTHVFINAVPDAPTGDENQSFAEGSVVESLEVTAAGNGTLNYYVMVEGEMVAVEPGDELMDDTVYYVTQTVEGCESEPLEVEVAITLGVSDFAAAGLQVYPNPVESMLTITSKEFVSQITITNLLGQKVMDVSVNANNTEINVSSLPQGTYILQVYGEEGKSYSTKIMRK